MSAELESSSTNGNGNERLHALARSHSSDLIAAGGAESGNASVHGDGNDAVGLREGIADGAAQEGNAGRDWDADDGGTRLKSRDGGRESTSEESEAGNEGLHLEQ